MVTNNRVLKNIQSNIKKSINIASILSVNAARVICTFPTYIRKNTEAYCNGIEISGCTVLGYCVGVGANLVPFAISRKDLDEVSWYYTLPLVSSLVTNSISGAYEYYNFKKQSKNLDINKNNKDSLVAKVETFDAIENKSIDTFINPWEIDIPKLENKVLNNSGGYS